MRKRVLFVSEAVTLAQIVRLVTLAQSLDRNRYEVHFASASFPDYVFNETAFERWHLFSRSADSIEKDVRRGFRLYTSRTLRRYVESDIHVVSRVRPHLIVGDLRWSLAVSAPICRVPWASLINAYWSPYACMNEPFPMPDNPLVDFLGEKRAAGGYALALPHVFNRFAAPLNTLRKRHGLPCLESLREVLTAGNWVLYPDVPDLVPVHGAPESHRWMGPIHWSPKADTCPDFSHEGHQRLVYVTLGSSGRIDIANIVVEGLLRNNVMVFLSTAGRKLDVPAHPRLRVFDFLPGDKVARASDLVVCNGGSTTGYQALAAGSPVLGLPSNLDQCLASQSMAAAGAGIFIAARNATVENIAQAAALLLEQPGFRSRAQDMAGTFTRWDASRNFREFVAEASSS